MTPRRRFFLFAGLLAAIEILIYAPALRGGWIWDDHMYVEQNLALRSLSGLRAIWLAPAGVNYFPVTATVQWIQWHLWGAAPLGYHLTNLVLHGASCLLLCSLLRRMGVPWAWLGGLLFAVHPLVVESVTWISELKNTLSLPPLLLALEAWMDCTDHPQDLRPYWRSLGWFVVAMLCKSTVVMFPALLLVYCWWRRGSVLPFEWLRSGPFWAVSAGLGLITVWFEHHRSMDPGAALPPAFLERTAGAGAAALAYLKNAVLPLRPSPTYAVNNPGGGAVWAQAFWIAAAAGAIGCARTRRRWARAVAFGLGWFLLNLLPVLGFVPMAYLRISLVADHFAYLPLLGIIALAAAGAGAWAARLKPKQQSWLKAAAVLVCGALAVKSRADTRLFADERTYWNTVVRSYPASWLGHNHLGGLLLVDGQTIGAETEFAAALRLRPGYPEAAANLAALHEARGRAFLRSNRTTGAVAEFSAALQFDPRNFSALQGLGVSLERLGRLPEAVDRLTAASRLQPGSAPAHTNLANALAKMGRYPAAIAEYQAALAIDPGFATARDDLKIASGLAAKSTR